MSFLAGLTKDLQSDTINSVGNLGIGGETVNHLFSNLTLVSFLLTALRSNVVKGRTSFDDEYDYIIIGGGSAGAVMASRLSQHPCVNVLLLEAGGEQPFLTEVPGFARIFLNTEMDWSYKTTPQEHACYGQKERRSLWNSGKCLGGGSSLNAMLYVRGNKENFNEWARQGCKGWSYKDIFHYFLKIEDNHNLDEVDDGYHGTSGPISVERSNYDSKLTKQLIEAFEGLGFPVTDVNGRRQFGVYDLQGTVRNQQRCSTSKGYLKPASRRPNLHIVTRAFVRKILIEKDENGRNRAYAVEVEHNDQVRVVRLRTSGPFDDGMGEIILSNGAVRTPQTLMLSGIGPREQLEKWNIPVIADLPVGKNLMDHNAAGMLYEVDPLYRNAAFKQIAPEDVVSYITLRQGPLCSISQNTILAFVNGLNNTSLPNDFPMQEIYFFDYNAEDAIRTLNLREEIEEQVFLPKLIRPIYLCAVQLLQPFSRGEVTLNSLDPHEFPDINPNYYADRRDIHYVVEGMKICKAVAEHPAMKNKMKAKWSETQRTDYPGCEQFEGDEDKYLECLARSVVLTIWHPSGTARMGDPKDPRSVVDPQLRVIGVDKLRVINAAIMPIIPSGNTNIPTMMIAEKGYDMMKGAIQCPSTLTIRGSRQVRDRGRG